MLIRDAEKIVELTLFLTRLFVLIVNVFQVRGTQSTSFIGILRKRSMNCVQIWTSNIHLDLSLRHNTWRISLSDKVIIINTVESPCVGEESGRLRVVWLKLLFIRELKVLWYRNFKPIEYHRPSFTKSLIQYWENIEVTDSWAWSIWLLRRANHLRCLPKFHKKNPQLFRMFHCDAWVQAVDMCKVLAIPQDWCSSATSFLFSPFV